MYIQRTLRNAFLAELLLFLMVANCAPSRPREDVGRLPGDPAPHHASRSSKKMGAGSSAAAAAAAATTAAILSGHQGKYRLSTACSGWAKHAGHVTGELLRFLPAGGADALGDPSDPDTEIRLISVDTTSTPWKLGAVWIYSPSRNRFLCFNKKGKLITKEHPSKQETLCQFYDTFAQDGQRRLTSVYHPKESRAPTKLPQVPIPIPFGSSHVVARRPATHGIDLDAWRVAFDRSGKPLKGSAWKSAKWSECSNIVYHNRTMRTVDHHAPVGVSDMFNIFKEIKTSAALDNKANTPKANQLSNASKTNGKSGAATKGAAKKGSKHGIPKAEAKQKSVHHHGSKRGGKAAKTRTTTTTPAPLASSEQIERRTNDVSFDSLLAETEQLLAQAAALPAAVAASIVPDDDGPVPVVEYSDPATRPLQPQSPRSTFILLDSGGWKEVVLGERPESQQPAAGQHDDISA